MNEEKKHFYFLSGIILIIVGLVSLTYSYIIPTTAYPYNAPASLTFMILGILFIIIGIILIILRGISHSSQKKEDENKVV
jgi:uncharacterized membrane protein HdeD (DUF308 family)